MLNNKNAALLIEDNLINIKVATYFLRECGITNIDIAISGNEAIALYKKNDYSIVLLDIGLPDISGIEVCQTIKKLSVIKKIPVIAVTAFSDIRDICILAGFDDFISKPVDINILKEVIDKWSVKN